MSPAALAAELRDLKIAGNIQTPLHDVHRKARMLASHDPDVTLGLGHLLPTTLDEILDGLGRLSGRPIASPASPSEGSWVDPEAVVEQVRAAGERLARACLNRERVFFGTGHPAGPIALYTGLARELALRGVEILEFAEAESFKLSDWSRRAQIRYISRVACVSGGGHLLHTHSPEPMEYLLDVGPLPDLVVGDHGFTGAGLTRGAEAVAIVDTNDPALILAWHRGLPIWPILCDDNRPPGAYLPLLGFLAAMLPDATEGFGSAL